MKFLVENWSLLIILALMIVSAIIYVKKFVELPDEEQLIKVREFLLWAVTEAERIYGGKTGNLKKAYAYKLFCEYFPSFVAVVPFDIFEKMVDSALVQMRHLIETNVSIKNYVQWESEVTE